MHGFIGLFRDLKANLKKESVSFSGQLKCIENISTSGFNLIIMVVVFLN